MASVAGFSTTLNSAVTKSIIRNMEMMNGSLEDGSRSKEGRESEEEGEEEEAGRGKTTDL